MKNSPNQQSKKGVTQRRQELSYMQRYRAKASSRVRVAQSLVNVASPILSGEEIPYSDKIADFFQKEGDLSTIKIQEQQSQSQIIKNQYIETQLMWFSKIDQMKSIISQIKLQCQEQKKLLQQLQRQLTDRKIKVVRLEQNWNKSKKANEAFAINNCEKQIANLQDQYDKLTKESQEELNIARIQRDQLLQQNQQLDQQIQQIRQQVQALSDYQEKSFNDRLNRLMIEEDNINQNIADLQDQDTQLQRKNIKLQQFRPIKEEMHRKYLQLYEKMHMNKQLDALQKLVRVKEQEMAFLQLYQDKKAIFNEKKSTIVTRQKILIEKQKKIYELTEAIKQKSTTLLNLYQYQNIK